MELLVLGLLIIALIAWAVLKPQKKKNSFDENSDVPYKVEPLATSAVAPPPSPPESFIDERGIPHALPKNDSAASAQSTTQADTKPVDKPVAAKKTTNKKPAGEKSPTTKTKAPPRKRSTKKSK